MRPNLYLLGYIFWSSEFDTNKTLLHTSSILHTVVFIYLIYWLIQTDITCTTTVVLQNVSLVGSLKIWYIYIYIYIYACIHTYKHAYVHTFHGLRSFWEWQQFCINPLHTELIPICNLLVLLGAHHILHISKFRVNLTWKFTPLF